MNLFQEYPHHHGFIEKGARLAQSLAKTFFKNKINSLCVIKCMKSYFFASRFHNSMKSVSFLLETATNAMSILFSVFIQNDW